MTLFAVESQDVAKQPQGDAYSRPIIDVRDAVRCTQDFRTAGDPGISPDRPAAAAIGARGPDGIGGISRDWPCVVEAHRLGAYSGRMSKQTEPDTGVAEAIPDCPSCHKPLPLCI